MDDATVTRTAPFQEYLVEIRALLVHTFGMSAKAFAKSSYDRRRAA